MGILQNSDGFDSWQIEEGILCFRDFGADMI